MERQLSDINKHVEQNYRTSYMSNAKWHKLIEALTTDLTEVYIRHKLIYSDVISGCFFDDTDHKPFFLEPIVYQEVEWIEIPYQYEDWKNTNNHNAGKTI